MTDLLDSFTRGPVAQMRDATLSGRAENEVALGPDVYLSWDPEAGAVAVDYSSAPGEIVTLAARVTGQPRWLTLNLALGTGAFGVGDTLGLVIAGRIDGGQDLPVLLRSRAGDGHEDTHWPEPLRLGRETGVATGLCTLAMIGTLGGRDGYHTLIIQLPRADFSLHLQDLRLFTVRPGLEPPGAGAPAG